MERKKKNQKAKPRMCLNMNITPGRSAPLLHAIFCALPLEEASKVSGIRILSCIKHQFWSFFIISLPKEKKSQKPNQQTNQQTEMMELFKCVITF